MLSYCWISLKTGKILPPYWKKFSWGAEQKSLGFAQRIAFQGFCRCKDSPSACRLLPLPVKPGQRIFCTGRNLMLAGIKDIKLRSFQKKVSEMKGEKLWLRAPTERAKPKPCSFGPEIRGGCFTLPTQAGQCHVSGLKRFTVKKMWVGSRRAGIS